VLMISKNSKDLRYQTLSRTLKKLHYAHRYAHSNPNPLIYRHYYYAHKYAHTFFCRWKHNGSIYLLD
jgi:hypothetical protein